MNSFPVNIEDYFARVLNIKMCMRKIFYPILLLALIACKGQQQTADSESVADPATESVELQYLIFEKLSKAENEKKS